MNVVVHGPVEVKPSNKKYRNKIVSFECTPWHARPRQSLDSIQEHCRLWRDLRDDSHILPAGLVFAGGADGSRKFSSQ